MPDKNLQRLWNKHFLTEIYRNIQTFAFKKPKACSSWASRNGTVSFFLTLNRNMFAGKLLKSEKVLAVWTNIKRFSQYFFNFSLCAILANIFTQPPPPTHTHHHHHHLKKASYAPDHAE